MVLPLTIKEIIMAFVELKHNKIRGIAACVPSRIEENIESHLMPKEDIQKFINATGIERRHCVDPGVCTSDLCQKAAQKLLNELDWDSSSIDLLVFVSHTTDYRLPSTSCLLQDRMGLPKSCIAFDVTLGCSGFLYGLSIIGKLMSKTVKRALLMVGNTQSVLMSPQDKSTYPLFGDAGTVTALEYVEEGWGDEMIFNYKTDGAGGKYTIIPDGGCRNPITAKSFENEPITEDGVVRNRMQYHMDGVEIFSCAVNEVPKCINELCDNYCLNKDDFDYFLIHQANKYMCEKIRKKAKISEDITPYNISNFGNTSGATIPLLMVTNLQKDLYNRNLNLLTATIGVGFSFGAAQIKTKGGIVVPDLLYY